MANECIEKGKEFLEELRKAGEEPELIDAVKGIIEGLEEEEHQDEYAPEEEHEEDDREPIDKEEEDMLKSGEYAKGPKSGLLIKIGLHPKASVPRGK